MKNIFLTLVFIIPLLGGLAGCYDDKGNYDYKNINTVDFVMKPESEDGFYRFKLRTTEFDVVFAPTVTQSLSENEDNLEYLWLVSYVKSGKSVVDSVTTKELTLTFPAQKAMSYGIIFRLTDVTTNVSSYASLSVKTVNPYVDSWLVLNGADGERRISAIEEPDSVQYVYTENAWTDMGNAPRFQDAVGMFYAPSVLMEKPQAPELLYVLTQDSLLALDPFAMQVYKTNKDLFSQKLLNETHELWYGVDGSAKGGVPMLVDRDYNFYYTTMPANGQFRDPYTGFVGSCRASKVTMASESNVAFIWDDEQKKFMFLPGGDGALYEAGGGEYDWKDKEVIWLGLDNVLPDGDYKDRVAMAIVKDIATGDYWAYHFDYGRNEFTQDFLGELDIDENSQFATTQAFESQFFYTSGSKVYRYNVAGREAEELYDAGATISCLKFRINETTNIDKEDYMRFLGIVVNKETEGELHELVLNTAGDVKDVHVFTGFGPIQDVCFTIINRNVL